MSDSLPANTQQISFQLHKGVQVLPGLHAFQTPGRHRRETTNLISISGPNSIAIKYRAHAPSLRPVTNLAASHVADAQVRGPGQREFLPRRMARSRTSPG
jgi:hypothetical protein